MDRKKIGKVSTLVLIIIILSGCSTSEILEENEKNTDTSINIDEEIDKSFDQINNNLKKIEGKKKDFQKTIKTESLFSDITELNKTESEEDTVWESKDGSYLMCEDGSIYYDTDKFINYQNILYDQEGYIRNDFNQICAGSSIVDYLPEEAIERFNSIVKDNNIQVGTINAYPLTKEVLTKLSKMFMSDEEYQEYLEDETNEPMKREFSDEDEAYLVSMDVCMDSYPLYNTSYNIGENWYDASYIWAIIKDDYVISLFADGIYDMKKESSVVENVVTKDTAQEMLRQKFEDDITKKGVECKDIEIKYAALEQKDGIYTFGPIYVFEIVYELIDEKAEIEEVTERVTEKILLDAEEGVWIE